MSPVTDPAARPERLEPFDSSVLVEQTGPQLHVQLRVHRVVDRGVSAQEEDRVTLLCSSEDLAHALCGAIETADLHQVQGTVWELLVMVLAQARDAALPDLADVRSAVPQLALHNGRHESPAFGKHVEHHEDPAGSVRRQQAARHLHAFLPVALTEGQRLHRIGNEIALSRPRYRPIEMAATLARAAAKAAVRRFANEPITGFGALS